MKDYNHIKGYHNNPFNAKLSSILDDKRTIVDIDCVLSKKGCKVKIILDHKKGKDTVGKASLQEYSKFVDDNTFCFIVRNDIDDKGKVVNNKTIAYEIKPIHEVKDVDDKSSFIKNIFTLCNDEELRKFFAVETHISFKNKLLNENRF